LDSHDLVQGLDLGFGRDPTGLQPSQSPGEFLVAGNRYPVLQKTTTHAWKIEKAICPGTSPFRLWKLVRM
jgi:hypothetical protein